MFSMKMSPINLDYNNILMSESIKILGKSKNLWDKRKKGANIWPRTQEIWPKNFAQLAGI